MAKELMTNSKNGTVIIHGHEWKLDDIRQDIEYCREQQWQWRKWKKRQALKDKSGSRSELYYGQKFDPKYYDLVADGWDHDHCLICWWVIAEHKNSRTDDAGYTDAMTGFAKNVIRILLPRISTGRSRPGSE